MNNTIEDFKTAMLKHGITPPSHLIGDSKLHRFYVDGDRKGTLNGAYTFHLDNKPSGWAMHFRTGVSFNWSHSGKREPLSNEMLRQIAYARQLRQKEQEAKHQQASQKAVFIWSKAMPFNDANQHSYLIRKHIKSHGIRLWRDALVIPLYDKTGSIVNLQLISADGTKRFLSGGRKKGCCFIIGEPTDKLLVCEGFATGASLHESTGNQVIVAFDAGNLVEIAVIIRRKYPESTIIVCGDNDLSGVGQEAARKAALACSGKYLIPPIAGQDFNDFINAGGVVHG